MKQKVKENIQRGGYGEIYLRNINKRTCEQIKSLVHQAAKADKIDDHGNWEFGCSFDKKGRGTALNWDLYGYGRDYHSKKLLCVIQIRQAHRVKSGYFLSIRKSYFLLGRNEDNSVFAHPVESRVIHHAIRKDLDVVLAVQNWIFNCNYKRVIRQGDLALIPVRSKPKGNNKLGPVLLENSHQLLSESIIQNDHLYAFNPTLTHLPNVHPEVMGVGWFKVVVGKRSDFWNFAAPTID